MNIISILEQKLLKTICLI